MKKFNYSIILLFVVFVSKAQDQNEYGFNKGDIFVSAALNYEESNKLSLLNPEVGYFATSNIAVGINSAFLLPIGDNFENIDSFEISAFGRYYFRPEKRFNPFAEVSLGYFKRTFELPETSSIDSQSDLFKANVAIGANYFLTKRLSIFAKIDVLDYINGTSESFFTTPERTSGSEFQFLPIDTGLYLGIQFKF